MAFRTTETAVTFRHPFRLSVFDGTQPAGTYRLVVDEERLEGLSFSAFQRTATMLHTPALPVAGAAAPRGIEQVFPVDPAELAQALEADAGI
ncbi:hypothetical protein EDC65_3919 [Stella humosa]|uniref:Uncharacterized protein n=1 Tax=Stella humosa TaxID=94 RepID=A0A3N1L596_9PROT|nr:hypothetical protein [Stella humosa]ROP84565.1 hypothetical protein EDC65_3919 [Stella humosa]BBK34085.1 hypothetical protein STHU_47190 [Stella humosa]